jgi:hypothetical protein
VSKRTHRRLAVVAGAALALGSMAPALAARVDGNAEATVDLDSLLGDVNGSALGLDGLLDLEILAGVLGTVQSVPAALLVDVTSLPTTVLGTAFGAVGIATQVVAGVTTTALDLETVGVVTETVGSVTGIVTGGLGGQGLTDLPVLGIVGGLLNGGLDGILSSGLNINIIASLLGSF